MERETLGAIPDIYEDISVSERRWTILGSLAFGLTFLIWALLSRDNAVDAENSVFFFLLFPAIVGFAGAVYGIFRRRRLSPSGIVAKEIQAKARSILWGIRVSEFFCKAFWLLGFFALLLALLAIGAQIVFFLKTSSWLPVSIVKALAIYGVAWAKNPTDWLGLYDVLAAVPVSLGFVVLAALCLVSFLIARAMLLGYVKEANNISVSLGLSDDRESTSQ